VVDDASTDSTVAIVRRYEQIDTRIQVFTNDINLGANKSFEKALQLASAPIIAISDQDDIWHPEKIAIMMRAWTADTLLIYCDSVRFEGKLHNAPETNKKLRRIAGTDPRKISVFNTVSGHALMLKKPLLPLALPFKEGIFYDWWLAIVAMTNGGISYVPEVLVYQRTHDKNLSIHKGLTQAQQLAHHKQMVLAHLKAFKDVVNATPEQTRYFQQLYNLWNEAQYKKFHWQLFFFLMGNRKNVYSYKKRKVGFFSYLKHSFRFARNKEVKQNL
jgi:glycosyltransferase involved in cell wall biosynthesis